jgi:predicted MFS family arabinose efflux permease
MILLRKDQGGSNPRPTQTTNVEGNTAVAETASFFPWLTIAYGFEGLGYIITGTFLVTLVENTAATHDLASYCWVIVGLAALPSCILWSFLAARWGAIIALVVAYLLQALGVLSPVVAPNAFGVYVGSILFGGTFMGITAMATNLARNLRPNESSKAIGLMTGVYGVGQIVGAAGAGILAHGSGGFKVPIIVASGLLCIGIIIILAGKVLSNQQA